MKDFPPLLQQRLTEEAVVVHARGLLAKSKNELELNLVQLRGDRTPIDRLLSWTNRDSPAIAAIKQVEQELTLGARADRALEFAGNILAKEIESGAETYLRDTHADYVRGLASFTYVEDWKRAIERFGDRLRVYLSRVGEARNSVVANYNQDTKTVSPAGDIALRKAAIAGAELEGEAEFLNKVVDEHETLIRGTPAAEFHLPRVPLGDYSGWVRALRTFTIGPMQTEFDRILDMCDLLAGEGLNELTKVIQKIDTNKRESNHSFVLEYVAILRKHANEHWVIPEETSEVISRLEDRYSLEKEALRH